MKDNANGCLCTTAVCAAIVGGVFWILGELIGLSFATQIAYWAGIVLVLSIYIIIVLWVFSFQFKEGFFIKTISAGFVLSIINFIVYTIFEWDIFYTVFVISAIITAIAIVVGLIKAIFRNC